MAQDTTPSIIMYQGGTNTFPVPFDKGYYGEVKVLFVRRGATGYEHEPASSNYVVSGRLYAWGAGSNYIYTHTPTPAVGAHVYNDQDEDSGKTVEATAGQTITVDGMTYIRATQHDISNHLILTWLGEELGVDDYICIGRDTERGQPYSLPNNQKHIEGALDNIERQVQELKDKTDNALVVDPTHTIDANKMGPIDWLETIVRSTDKTARAIRYHNGYLQFSLEDPDVPLDQKTWTSILNTINVTTIREWYDEEKNEYRLQYSKDNGVSWKELPLNFSSIPGLEARLSTIESEQVVLSSGVAANTSAVQRNQIDINTNTVSISSLRLDMNAADAVLRESINANADKITTKQDRLTAGDNIVISGNTISATGAGGGAGLDMVVVDQLPATGRKGIIYLVKKDGAAPDIHDEYVWIESTQSFELIGTTQVDLSGYAKKAYVDSADLQLKANQDSLYANQVVLSGMLNTKDADGNWTALTTSAQAAIPAINELNEKIESAGDASLPEQADIENSKIYNIPLFDGTKLLINNSLRFRWYEFQNGGVLSLSKTNTSFGSGSLCVGIDSSISGYTGQTAIGHRAKTSAAGATAIGWAQVSAECAVHIGSNYLSATDIPDNSVRGSFMWTNNDGSYLLFNRDGTIPAERMSATAGTTGQVLTKTDTGMAWQDAAGGGGTKVIIKRYS